MTLRRGLSVDYSSKVVDFSQFEDTIGFLYSPRNVSKNFWRNGTSRPGFLDGFQGFTEDVHARHDSNKFNGERYADLIKFNAAFFFPAHRVTHPSSQFWTASVFRTELESDSEGWIWGFESVFKLGHLDDFSLHRADTTGELIVRVSTAETFTFTDLIIPSNGNNVLITSWDGSILTARLNGVVQKSPDISVAYDFQDVDALMWGGYVDLFSIQTPLAVELTYFMGGHGQLSDKNAAGLQVFLQQRFFP